VKERHGSSWTTRHDMIVSCLYLRLSREFNAELEIKTHSHLQTRARSRTPGHRQVQDHRRGRHPAPPDGPLLQREAQEAQGRDSRSSTGRTAPSTQSPGGT
ncbi:Ankyrin repeat protein, partial [Giardia duodenalis]